MDNDWTPAEIDNTEELTLLSAVCQVIDVVNDSEYNPRIFEVAARPIAYIANKLSLTETEAVIYATVMDIYYDGSISISDIARCLGIKPIKAMKFNKQLDALCKRKFLIRNTDSDSHDKTYRVSAEAVTSLQEDTEMVIKEVVINNIDDWFSQLDNIVVSRCQGRIDYNTLCQRIGDLVEKHKDMPFLKLFKTKEESLSTEDKMLFWWGCNMVVSDSFETIEACNFKKLYENMAIYRQQRKSLSAGTNNLLRSGLFRVAQNSDNRIRDCYELTPWVMEKMLAELELGVTTTAVAKDLMSHDNIVAKQMYYNPREQQAIERLTNLLQPARFAEVRADLVKKGFRSGFACIFHGAPGTGKTETVLQIARATGRDIMQVNISEIKSMWVGESEKNIKQIFSRYRKLVEESEVAPILLFNEADAIIGKRLENVTRSVDKMENSMQNIILEEIERLDGILIATTNLTCNMDKAFERRFLYKIEFERPTMEAKCAIWKSMIEGLNDDDAKALATKYNFSGGQIENIARKSVVDRILTGEELSLEALYGHCDAEFLDRKTTTKIGY